jgi:hypothetical protein
VTCPLRERGREREREKGRRKSIIFWVFEYNEEILRVQLRGFLCDGDGFWCYIIGSGFFVGFKKKAERGGEREKQKT